MLSNQNLNYLMESKLDEDVISDYISFIIALAGTEHENQIVLNLPLLEQFKGIKNGNGTPTFTIDGRTINGIPYHLINVEGLSTGFVGPFETHEINDDTIKHFTKIVIK